MEKALEFVIPGALAGRTEIPVSTVMTPFTFVCDCPEFFYLTDG